MTGYEIQNTEERGQRGLIHPKDPRHVWFGGQEAVTSRPVTRVSRPHARVG